MKFFFTASLFILLSLPAFGQQIWVNQTGNGIETSGLYPDAVSAIDSMNVIVGGQKSYLFKSTDGGKNWNNINISSIASNQYINCLDMLDKNNIWAGADARILHSTDGGNNWVVQYYDTNTTKFINYIEMFDANNGVAMGDGDWPMGPIAILKTTDGGQNWNQVNTQAFGGVSGDGWRRIDFVNMNVGYFFESGWNPQKLMKTTDGGAHWDSTNYSLVNSYSMVLKFYDENIGFSYSGGKMSYTLDGGATWDTTRITFADTWGMDIKFLKNNSAFKVLLAAGKDIYISADTGKTWNVDPDFHNLLKSPRAIGYPDAKHAWVLTGGGGTNEIWRWEPSITSGVENQDAIPSDFSLSQNYPNPFNPSTIIAYSLPQKGFVTIRVFDMLGKEVSTLVNSDQAAGRHQVNFKAAGLPSGIYFYKISSGSFTKIKKMILLK